MGIWSCHSVWAQRAPHHPKNTTGTLLAACTVLSQKRFWLSPRRATVAPDVPWRVPACPSLESNLSWTPPALCWILWRASDARPAQDPPQPAQTLVQHFTDTHNCPEGLGSAEGLWRSCH